MEPRVKHAVDAYYARKEGFIDPHGTRDNEGLWFPIAGEYQSCCNNVMQPTPKNPNVLMRHCRSIQHVAKVYNVRPSDLRTALRGTKGATR
jgi:hypothetical protein